MGTGREQQAPVVEGAPQSSEDSYRPVPLLLRVLAFSTFFFPSSMVLAPLGAVGTVPMILAALLLLVWFASALFGLHDPIGVRHPAQIGPIVFLLATCLSYVALYSGWTGPSTVAARASADRWLILILVSTAIALVVADTVRTIGHALVLVRALLGGAYICSAVALVQFQFGTNPVEWLQQVMPGFTYNGGDTTFQQRGALVRVAGTTFSPIELSVVCSMLLPLSIWRGVVDPRGRKWLHWLGTALLVFALALTVSRSGILGFVVAMVVFLPFLPAAARQWALVAVPAGVAILFLSVPGLMGTFAEALTAGGKDPSISTRTNNWPRVVGFFEDRPWLGKGPGNYLPENALHILDNQYLNTLVTMGVVGLLGLCCYFLFSCISAVMAAQSARSSSLRSLAGAVAAGAAVATVCSFTFDSLSFPVFALTFPMFVGLSGAVWLMVAEQKKSETGGH